MGFQRHERRMSHQYLCSIYSKWKDNSILMSISAQNGHSHADELHSGFMGYTVHSSSNMTVIYPLSVSVWVHVSAPLNTLTVSAVSECVRCKSVNHSLQISHLLSLSTDPFLIFTQTEFVHACFLWIFMYAWSFSEHCHAKHWNLTSWSNCIIARVTIALAFVHKHAKQTICQENLVH